MATLIDSLYLSIGLDPSQFEKGSKDLLAIQTKTKDEMVRQGKLIEEQGKKVEQSIQKITTVVLSLFAVLLGGRGFKEFIADVNNANAALGRFSANLGQSPQDVGAFTALVELMGGSASDAGSALEAANKIIQDFLVNGKGIPEVISRMTAQVGGNVDFSHGVLAYYQTLAPILQRMNAIDPAKAHAFAEALSIPDSAANAMVKYGAGFKSAMDARDNLQPTTNQIKVAQDLQTAWISVTQEVGHFGSEINEQIAGPMTDLVNKTGEFIKMWGPGIAGGLGEFITTFKKGLGVLKDDIDALIDKLHKLWAATGIHVVNATEDGPDEVVPQGQSFWDRIYQATQTPEERLRNQFKGTAGSTPPPSFTVIPGGIGGTRGITIGGKSIDLQRADDQIFPGSGAARNIGFGEPQALKVSGSAVSTGNPLPVMLVNRGVSFWDWLSGGVGGDGGGGNGGGLAGAIGSAVRFMFGGGQTGGGGGGDAPYTYDGPTTGPGSLTKLIDDTARKYGLDPRTLEGIRSGESLHQKKYDVYITPREQSYGPFQLNRMHRGDAGWLFEQETAAERKRLGLGDLRDPRTIALQVDWVARYIKAHGAGPWHGGNHPFRYADPKWQNSGYDPNAIPSMSPPPVPNVISGAGGAALSTIANNYKATTTDIANSMHIGAINVNAPNATDASGIAAEIKPALARNYFAQFSNSGPM